MKTRTLKQILLYNYRYWFAYAIGTLIMFYFLLWKLNLLGPGLAPEEIQTAASNLHLARFLELPLYPVHSFLQWLSMHLLGATEISIRLASVAVSIGVITAVFFTIKNWSNQAVALVSVPFLVSADWFLFVARLGTSTIEFSLWLAVAIFALLKVFKSSFYWLPVLTLSLVMFFFVPFGPYVIITLITGILIFKPIRQKIMEAPKSQLITVSVIFALSLVAFILLSIFNHTFAQSVFGLNALPGSIGQYFKNILDNSLSILLIWPNSSPLANLNGIFMIRFFELAFVLLGIYALWRARSVRLPLFVLIMLVVLSLLSGLGSNVEAKGLILVPIMILIANGLNFFIKLWRRTFPKNPYARMVAYIPLGMLLIGVIGFHYIGYFNVWGTQTSTFSYFTKHYSLLRQEVWGSTDFENCIVVANSPAMVDLAKELPVNYRKYLSKIGIKISQRPKVCNLSYSQTAPEQLPANTKVIVMNELPQPSYEPASVRPLISERKNDFVRWLVYQK